MKPATSNSRWFRILRQRVNTPITRLNSLRNGRLIVVFLLAPHLCSDRLKTSLPFDEAGVVSLL